jgi:Acetyltransferase (GNAT) domain
VADPRSERPLRVRSYRPGDEHAIAELFRSCFGRDRPLAEWRWRFVDGPAAAQLIVLCDGDRIVGSLSRSGFATFVDTKRALCLQSGDAMVHPEYRGCDGLALMMETARSRSFDLSLYAPTEVSARVARRKYSSRFESSPMPQWVRWRPDLVRPLLAVLRPRRLRPQPLSDPGPEVDALAEASALFAPCIRVRDARYLRWRWLDQPGTDWRVWAVGDLAAGTGGIVAFGVDPRHDPPERGRIVDLLARDEPTTVALLVAAADELGRAGCKHVALDYHDPRRWSRRACYRAGFIRRGQGPLMRGGAMQEWTRPWGDHFESWYLTRGDTDLC